MVTAGSLWSMTQTHPWLQNPRAKPHTEQLRNVCCSHFFNPLCTMNLTAKSTLLTIQSIHKPAQNPSTAPSTGRMQSRFRGPSSAAPIPSSSVTPTSPRIQHPGPSRTTYQATFTLSFSHLPAHTVFSPETPSLLL